MHLNGLTGHVQSRRDTPWLRRTVTPMGSVTSPATIEDFAAWIEDPCPPDSGDARAEQWATLLDLATSRIVEVAGREMVAREIRVDFDAYAEGRIPAGGLVTQALPTPEWLTIPRVPADPATVVVETVDNDGNTTTVDPGSYDFDAVSVPHRLHLIDPPIRGELTTFNGIRVSFNAGYSTPSDVPSPLRLAVVMYAAWLYEQRGMDSSGGLSASGALDVIGEYRVRVGL